LVVALEDFLINEETRLKRAYELVDYIVNKLNTIKNIEVEVIPNNEEFHEHPVTPLVPRIKIKWDEKDLGISSDNVDKYLIENDPPIHLRNRIYCNYYTNKSWRIIDTYCLRKDEAKIIVNRLREIFS
jgi:hypothetical protein